MSRPHSCPLRDPEFELDYDDFLDSGEELDTVVENLQTHFSVSTQTDWMFDEGELLVFLPSFLPLLFRSRLGILSSG